MKNAGAKVFKVIALLLSFLFIFEQSGFAQALPLPAPLVQDTFRPLHLRYLSYDATNNNFRLLLDKGSLKNPNPEELKNTTNQLLNYFSVGLTLPSESFWVNLRPDGESNIIDEELAKTDLGRVMLEADLQLKKDTANSTSPKTPEGRAYWDKLYKKAEELFGSENVTVPTLTRVWIVPDEIILSETPDSVYTERGQRPSRSAYIYKATLKVLLEQDYLKDSTLYNFSNAKEKALNEYSSQLFRETIIPKLTKEVNTSKRYAPLRQVYYSLIMAEWFKARFSDKKGLPLKGTVPELINSRNLTGLTSKEPWSKTTYFKAYQKSANKGEYNIQETINVPFSAFHEITKRYVCGGVLFNFVLHNRTVGDRVEVNIPKSVMPPVGNVGYKGETQTTVYSGPSNYDHSAQPDNNVSRVEVKGTGEIYIDKGITIPQVSDSSGTLGTQVSGVENLRGMGPLAGKSQEELRTEVAAGRAKIVDGYVVPKMAGGSGEAEEIEPSPKLLYSEEFKNWLKGISREDLRIEIQLLRALTFLINNLQSSNSGAQAEAAGAVKALVGAGVLDKEMVKKKLSLTSLINNLQSSDSWVQARAAGVVKALAEAGVLDKEMVKEELLTSLINNLQSSDSWAQAEAAGVVKALAEAGEMVKEELLTSLIKNLQSSDSGAQAEAAGVVKALVEAGVLDKEMVKKKLPLTSLINNLQSSDSWAQAEAAGAVKALAEAGVLDKEMVKEELLTSLINNLQSSDSWAQARAAGAVKALAEAGVLDKEMVKIKIDLSASGKSVPEQFHYYYLRLLEQLKDDIEAAYRTFDYLDQGLLALAQAFITDNQEEDFFYQRLAEIIKEGRYSAEEAEYMLTEEMFKRTGLGYFRPTRSWDNLQEWLNALEKFSLLTDKISSHIIATMKLLQAGVGEQAGFRAAANVETRLPEIRQALIRLLGKPIPILAKRRLVKALALGAPDQIDRLRNQAINLAVAVTGSDTRSGLVGEIRDRIHNRPSPQDLAVARAYRAFVGRNDASSLNKLGYAVSESDRITAYLRQGVLDACDNLIATLEDIYGEGSISSLQEYFQRWQNAVTGQDELKVKISALLNSAPGTSLDSLEGIIQIRQGLHLLLNDLTGEALLLTILLDNRLELLFYRRFNEIKEKISFSTPQEALKGMLNLLENTRLNGYAEEELGIISREISSLSLKESFVQEDWLKLYSVYKRIERSINSSSQSAIADFQEMAERLASGIGAGQAIWVENFSSNIFRSDTIYLLSLALKQAKEIAMQKAEISGWQVVVAGEAEGRVRFIQDIHELKSVKPDEIIVVAQLPSEAPPVTGAAAIITLKEDSLLSHPAIRARQHNIPFVVCPDIALLDGLSGQWAKLTIKGEEVVLSRKEEPVKNKGPPQPTVREKISLIPADLNNADILVMPENYRSERVGNKSFRLQQIPAELLPGQFSLRHFSLSFSLFKQVLDLEANSEIKARLLELKAKALRNPSSADIPDTLAQMRLLIEGLAIPDGYLSLILETIEKVFGKDKRVRLFLRSSTNAEDLTGYQAAGLYDSFGNVRPEKQELAKHIKKVWASVWNDRAFFDRQVNGIDHTKVFPAILVQEMVAPDYAFVIHTQNPTDAEKDEVIIELVQGLGESLVSGSEEFAGSPYRFIYNRKTGRLRLIKFANKSKKLILEDGVMKPAFASYQDDKLLSDEGREFIRLVAQAAVGIEAVSGFPQDIEGALLLQDGVWKVVFLQSRDQHLNGADNKTGHVSPSISSTGTGDEIQANRNILEGILETAVRQGLITEQEKDRRLREFDANPKSSLDEDIDLEADDQSVFLINGQKVIVIDRDYLSTTEEGEQYASAGLRRGVVYITREKFKEWQGQGLLEQKIKHEQDEVAYLRKKALEMFPGLDETTAYELMSNFLKNSNNAKEAKALIAEAHDYAKAQSASNAGLEETEPSQISQISTKEEYFKMLDGAKIFVSPNARQKMEQMDSLIRDRDIVAEIGAIGLTKETSEGADIVDLVLPDRIFDMQTFMPESRENKLATLIGSKGLRLDLDGDSIVLKNDEGNVLLLDEFGWFIVKGHFLRLTNIDKNIVSTYSSLKEFLREHGSVVLDSDWDIVITGVAAWFTDNYWIKLKKKAIDLDAKADFLSHHHPQLGLAVVAIQDKSQTSREKHYQTLLTPSEGDKKFARANNIRWLEVRAFGTVENLGDTSKITNKVYDMESSPAGAKDNENGDSSAQPLPVSDMGVDTKVQEQSDNSSGFSKTGGIDFRNLPLVRKAIGSLKPNLDTSSMDRLNSMNLDTEWQEIENLVSSGVIPSAESIREYIQASCLKGNADKDIDKVISCIADILRIEEERYVSTEPLLQYILIAVESANSVQQIKAAFIGTTP